MKTTDPIPLEWQGKIFGVFLFGIIPFGSLYLIYFQKAQIAGGWLLLATIVWYLQMAGVLIGYHRYFSHRSFKTGKVTQFVLGLLGCISGQKGPIFWACHHRMHHSSCEEEHDIHSPYQYGQKLSGLSLIKGFLWSHFMHLVENGPTPVEDKWVQDLLKQPSIVFLEKQATLIYYLFGAAMVGLWGWNGLVWGFFVPSFFSWNCVMLVNSAVHIWGEKPYISKLAPKCNARNIWWLSIPMLGDNWHNNHHADMTSARAGFYWWQLDLNYVVIWTLGKLGLAWDIKGPNWKLLEEMENNADNPHLPEEIKEQGKSTRKSVGQK